MGYRVRVSLWRRDAFGFGFGIWRVVYTWHIWWTICIGPCSIYIKLHRKEAPDA